MKTQEWVETFNKFRTIIKEVVLGYHPAISIKKPMNITAHNAEEARQNVASAIREVPDISLFDQDLSEDNIDQVYNIMNEAWFGVPESTDCWKITGFPSLVNLLEDPPEEQE